MDTTQTIDNQAIFESFLAARRAKHGDMRMEAETDPNAQTPEGGDPAGDQGGQTDQGDQSGQEPPKEDPKPEDELPEWARKKLSEANAEAANYRVRLREAESKLAEAKTPEEFETALTEFRTKNAELERNLMVTKVSTKHKLPPELAARLQGDDEAALEADAKALAALIVVPKSTPESLSGGLTPGESDEEFDPVVTARKARIRRY